MIHENLRVSNYTITTPVNDRVVLINSLTGAIDEVDHPTWDKCQREQMDSDVGEYLCQRGHLTRLSPEDERVLALRAWSIFDKFARKRGAVVICPSVDCNFRCTYCFERPLQDRIDCGSYSAQRSHLTLSQVDEIFDFFPKILEYHAELQENITLFGGEPLWARNYDVVAKITTEAVRRGHTVSAITNGYELIPFRPLLGRGGISSIQVSLDGLAEMHDSMRLTVLGEGTFDRIIEQLLAVITVEGLHIEIRMNYDSKNLGGAHELLNFLRRKGIVDRPNVTFHANLISMTHVGMGKDYKTLKTLPVLAPSMTGIELDCYTTGLRQTLLNALESEEPFYRKAHFCAATSGMYVFCPDGSVYACWEGIGEDHSRIGTFGKDAHFDERSMTRWQRRTAPAMTACQTCSHLFVCGGGCAIHALERTGDINACECDGIKKKFGFMVQNVFRERQAGVPVTQAGNRTNVPCA